MCSAKNLEFDLEQIRIEFFLPVKAEMSHFLISIIRYLVPKFETIYEKYAKNWTLNGLKPSGAPNRAPNMYQESTPIFFSLQTCIRGPGLGPPGSQIFKKTGILHFWPKYL